MVTNAEAGDRVLVQKKPVGSESGIFLESHEPGVVLLKLDSGYNIGIKKEDIKKIIVKEKAKQEKIEEKEKRKGGKPIIDIIMTGGTISSSLDSKTGGVKPLTSPDALFKFYPEVFDLADIRVISPFMKFSENMLPGDWLKIAKLVVKSINDENVRGVIVTHGTDTLHYTSAALSFMIKNLNKPVVLTYSQRSTDRGSSDAELNLFCAAKMALSDVAEVMLVGHAGLNDDYCYALPGTKVRKMHTSRRDTFKAINDSPIAKIYRDKIEILRSYNKRNKNEAKLDNSFEENIALLKYYPGQNPDILDYLVKKKYKGIIIEMTGLGQVLTEGAGNWIPVLKKIIDDGIVVCATAQTIYGRLDPMVYSSGRELEKAGVIYLKDILSETAFVKLGWVLGHSEWSLEEKKAKMLENISREFNERLVDEVS